MIQRAGYDLLRVGLRLAWQLWPVWVFWWAWNFPSNFWLGFLRTFPSSQPGNHVTLGYQATYLAWPTAALLGPSAIMAAGITLHRARVGSRTMAPADILGLTVITSLFAAVAGFCVATCAQLTGSHGASSARSWRLSLQPGSRHRTGRIARFVAHIGNTRGEGLSELISRPAPR